MQHIEKSTTKLQESGEPLSGGNLSEKSRQNVFEINKQKGNRHSANSLLYLPNPALFTLA
jgi:hypothetical protein